MPDIPKHLGDHAEQGAEPGQDGPVSTSRTKQWIVVVASVAVLLVAGAIGAYLFMGESNAPGVVTIDIGGETVYHEFPEILTQLKSGERGSDHVKLEIVIELSEGNVNSLENKQAAIIDAVQSYLRGKSRADLAGEVGAEQLRADLLVMINQRIAPATAKDILFKTFLID